MTNLFHRHILAAGLCVMALSAAAWWWLNPAEAAATGPTAVEPHARPARQSTLKPAVPTPSLAMTDPARLFEIGFAGGLVLDTETRRAVEALLTQMSESPSAADMGKLRTALHLGLSHEDAEQALKLIVNYRAYLVDLQRQLPDLQMPQTTQTVDAYFDRMEQTQRHHLGDAQAQALFHNDMQFARVNMQATLINHDAQLTDRQRHEQIEALRARLPLEQRDLLPPATPRDTVPPATGS